MRFQWRFFGLEASFGTFPLELNTFSRGQCFCVSIQPPLYSPPVPTAQAAAAMVDKVEPGFAVAIHVRLLGRSTGVPVRSASIHRILSLSQGNINMWWHLGRLFSQPAPSSLSPSPSVVRALAVLSTTACLYSHWRIATSHAPLLFIPYEPHTK